MKLSMRAHPDVLFAYRRNHVDLILRLENPADKALWLEADVSVPDKLSLGPDCDIRKGRLRVGILQRKEFLEKAVKVYAGSFSNPQMYPCKVTVYAFDKDGIIESRFEKDFPLRCEAQKEARL